MQASVPELTDISKEPSNILVMYDPVAWPIAAYSHDE